MTTLRKLRILMLEDRPADAELAVRELRRAGLQFVGKHVATEGDFLAQLRDAPPDIILADYSLPAYDGLTALAAAQKECPGIPFIFVSGTMGEETAIEALKHGATDYVLKHRWSRLGPAVQRALREVEERAQRRQAEESLRASERNYREIFNATNDAIFVHDAATGAIVDVNQTTLDMFGYSRAELLKPGGEELRGGAAFSYEEAVRRIRRAAAEGPQVFEWQSRRKNGELFWTEVALRAASIGGQGRVLAVVRDITERKRAQAALAESQGLLKAILDHIPDPAWLKDLQGRFLAGNELLARFYGVDEKDIVGMTVFDVRSPQAERLAREDQEVIATRKPIRIDELLTDAWGQRRWFETIKSPIFNERGEVTGTVGIARETTERRQTDEALRVSEERFRSVWEQSIDGMRLTDGEGRILAVNDAFCRLVKLPPEKLIGKVFSVAFAGQGPEEDLEVYRQRFEAGTMPALLTARFRLWNSEDLDVEVSISFVGSGQQSKAVLGIFRDIGERKRMQSEVALREQRLNAFFTGATAGLALLDKNLRFVQINETLAEMNGLPAREHLGRTVREVLPKLAPVVEPLLQKVLATGEPILNYELAGETSSHPGVQRYWVESFFPITGPDGRPEGVGGIVVEVTDRKQLEQQLRQAQKMEAIGQLAGGVAHDFNNMLAVIRGNAELLLMDAEQHTPETKECLKQVTAASERAANLTRQLLAFSRKQVMQSRPLVLNDVIGDLTKMLRRIIGEHIDLQCRYAAQLPYVEADAGMIEQVLLNLAVNARDAMPRGGQLLITTEMASFEAAYALAHPEADAGEFVCLTVSDTGTGIGPEHLPRIFEPFFTTKEPGKGTGLGLATVYGIVKQHQGWIEVASQPGAGATFRIFLPAIPAPAKAAVTGPAEADPPRGTETILLVEDDYAVRMITRRVLESHGYKVYAAASAREGLELWRGREKEIALLLSDIVMPEGVTGRELAEQLRATAPALKVILMSGYSAEVIGKDTDFFRRSKTHFLQKPCPARTVLETVRRCLDGK